MSSVVLGKAAVAVLSILSVAGGSVVTGGCRKPEAPVGAAGPSAPIGSVPPVADDASLAERMTEIVEGRGTGTVPRPAPAEVTAALADSAVDFDELLRAARATVACLREHGVEATDPTPSPGGRFVRYQWSVTTPPGLDAAARNAVAQRDHDACYLTHEALISEAWVRQTTLSEQARQERIDDIAGCLRNEGVTVAEHASEAEVFGSVGPDAATPARLACLARHQEELAVPDDGQGR